MISESSHSGLEQERLRKTHRTRETYIMHGNGFQESKLEYALNTKSLCYWCLVGQALLILFLIIRDSDLNKLGLSMD